MVKMCLYSFLHTEPPTAPPLPQLPQLPHPCVISVSLSSKHQRVCVCVCANTHQLKQRSEIHLLFLKQKNQRSQRHLCTKEFPAGDQPHVLNLWFTSPLVVTVNLRRLHLKVVRESPTSSLVAFITPDP